MSGAETPNHSRAFRIELLSRRRRNGLIYAVGGYRPATLNTVDQYSPPVTIYTFIKT
jgi:hypothetical protein